MNEDREEYRKPHIPGYIGGSPGRWRGERKPLRRGDDVDEERRRAE